ncbi:hypothetical protein AVEN_140951-1 [Araneus ventricosus]|uniref:Uncharacterized protein n=1 Tax=Araneus ventricosus TaxID=182803 RepID=A0A4Y2GAZ1_ARAVE|nr:hypothetical protein AVEN_140951-1 [Araneus ventricosus]
MEDRINCRFNNSRSYDTNTENKMIRRNRNWLKQARGNGNKLREESNNDTTQNVRQEEEKGMQQSNIEGNMPRLIGFGRVIKTPKRYKD